MAWTLEALGRSHPCFAVGARNGKGRVHLPVSPGCNMACRFCKRALDNADTVKERRPGRAAEVLCPDEAVEAVARAVKAAPEISVAGIAGPGEPLATPYALETLRLIKRAFPDLLLCLSTNGLALIDNADEIRDVGVDTLTVTINSVSPKTQAKICAWVRDGKRCVYGEEGAALLIEKQLEGLARVARNGGPIVKVNTVYIPALHGAKAGEFGGLEDIARTVKAAGATLYNLIPLIPQGGFEGMPPPTCSQIDAAREAVGKYITVFRHCQHCRADAAGVPGGRDVSCSIYPRRVAIEETFSHG
ncbi:MAG: radical SAM protein [Oscillospiraceae bacterium]|jgi:nitrogen fixation protein NifB|nr:radical SAM protein [Oscillospiraceae bacterium]